VSKRINVNPDHYKVAGRERPGDVAGRSPKTHVREDEKERLRWERRSQKNKGRENLK
jgi:hypothetical protein